MSPTCLVLDEIGNDFLIENNCVVVVLAYIISGAYIIKNHLDWKEIWVW